MKLPKPKFKKGNIVYYPTLLGGVRKARVAEVIKFYDDHKFDHYGYLVCPVDPYYFETVISDYIYTDRSNAYRGHRRWKARSNIG